MSVFNGRGRSRRGADAPKDACICGATTRDDHLKRLSALAESLGPRKIRSAMHEYCGPTNG